MKATKRFILLFLSLVLILSFAACTDTDDETSKDETSGSVTVEADFPDNRRDASARSGKNATQPLVIGTMPFDGKFNPFYATGGYDVDIVEMTQIMLIAKNEKAEAVAGIDENCLAYDFKMTVSEEDKSIYEFVLKDGITFSDGTPVTGNDVLFNLYVYLDPAYSGPSTLYSMNIEGLNAYRTQIVGEDEIASKEKEFSDAAMKRIEDIIAGTGTDKDIALAWDKAKTFIADDSSLLQEMLQLDYSLADFGVGSDWPNDFPASAVILGFMGNITCENGVLEAVDSNVDLDKLDEYTEQEAVELAWSFAKDTISLIDYDINFGKTVITDGIVDAASESSVMYQVFKNDETLKYLDENKGNVKNISGITLEDVVCDDEKTREKITVVLDGVDPSAVWNFCFAVAPMNFYSTEALAAEANGTDRFGVEFSSVEFQNQLKEKVVPVGAGPYIAADSDGNETTEFDKFYKDGILHFVANDDFMLSAPLIKNIRFKTITAGSEITALESDEVHYSKPNASSSVISSIAGTDIKHLLVDALGYGYIGINSKLIPDINARKAIAHAVNTELALEFYTGGLAETITRSMSKVSWAYPQGAENLYPFDETAGKSKEFFLKSDNFKEDKDGNIVNANGSKVKYTFVIPDPVETHPTGQIFLKAKEVLEKIGVEITIDVDSEATLKLQEDVVQVWTAAWQADIDPDMFQVFCSDNNINTAGTPKQYGLYWLYENGTEPEKELLNRINENILIARKSLNTDERKPIYSQILDDIAELCVEIPTYQRKDMFAYNGAVIDGSTLWQEVTPYKEPLAEIWDVSFVLD